MAEPHDRCAFLGCTLGREHTDSHAGPPCPACGKPSRWDGNVWCCTNGNCNYVNAVPVPAEPARQPMPAAAPVAPAADPGPCRHAPCGLAAGHKGACRGPFGQPLTMVAENEPALAELDRYLIDLQAEATEHDENARHHQRLAKDARDRAAHLRAWRSKAGR